MNIRVLVPRILILLNTVIFSILGCYINRLDINAVIYICTLFLVTTVYAIKYKNTRKMYIWFLAYVFLIILWKVSGIKVYSSIIYIFLLLLEIQFYYVMCLCNKDNYGYSIKCMVFCMSFMAIYGIVEGILRKNFLFVNMFRNQYIINYNNMFLYKYNAIGSMEESLIFGTILTFSGVLSLYTKNTKVRYVIYFLFGLAIFFTNKRSGMFFWFVSLLLYMFLNVSHITKKKKAAKRMLKAFLIITSIFCIVMLIRIDNVSILGLVAKKFNGIFGEDSRSFIQRYGALMASIEYIFSKNSIFRFLFGNGINSLVNNFVIDNKVFTDLGFYVVDNQYLTTCYDYGFVVLMIFICVIIRLIYKNIYIIKSKEIEGIEKRKSIINLILLVLVVAFSFILDVLTWYQCIYMIGFSIAINMYNIDRNKRGRD